MVVESQLQNPSLRANGRRKLVTSPAYDSYADIASGLLPKTVVYILSKWPSKLSTVSRLFSASRLPLLAESSRSDVQGRFCSLPPLF